jgi:hypothetical protein
MRKILILLLATLLLVALAGASILHAPFHRKHQLSSSNVCQQAYNSVLRVGNLFVEVGTSSLDTSTGTPVEIIPLRMVNVNNLNLEVHPEHQFTFVAASGAAYPRAFGVPAFILLAGHNICFTLGYKGGSATKCPFDGAGLSYYSDQNHQNLAANWQLIWAPCG